MQGASQSNLQLTQVSGRALFRCKKKKITSFARARGERSLYLKVSVGGIRRLEVPNRIFSEGECGRCTHGVSRCTRGTHTKCDLTGNGFSFS